MHSQRFWNNSTVASVKNFIEVIRSFLCQISGTNKLFNSPFASEKRLILHNFLTPTGHGSNEVQTATVVQWTYIWALSHKAQGWPWTRHSPSLTPLTGLLEENRLKSVKISLVESNIPYYWQKNKTSALPIFFVFNTFSSCPSSQWGPWI